MSDELNYDEMPADVLGRSLKGIGINLLSRDVPELAGFLSKVFEMTTHQVTDDFAVMRHGGMVLQLHGVDTFASHPIYGLLPESGAKGGGVQIYLFDCDPDAAVARAEAAGFVVAEPPTDKPHGLREATVLTDEGFAITAAMPMP